MHIVERLAQRGITPAEALVEAERSPKYMAFIASDDGQDLLEWLADDAASRRGSPIQAKEPTDD